MPGSQGSKNARLSKINKYKGCVKQKQLAKAAGHVSRSLPDEVMEHLASIRDVIEGPILAAGDRALDGFLSLSYVETDPEERRQRAMHRGLLMALLH